ncbi:MAG TPA: hypothetical protein VFQ07_06145 [Candidatus Polarisedimenticolia bacterium]|nr:hypothetical protein [Candidatus Polarisedimenticolia bacterium]
MSERTGAPGGPGGRDDAAPESARLRGIFRELHDEDFPAPAYQTLAAAGASAAPASTGRPVRIIVRAAWALGAAAAACAVVLALRDGALLRPAPGEEETLRLAASLTHWEAPTDFLLSTPGAEFLQSSPRLGSGTGTLSGDRTDLLQNDTNENDTEDEE